MLFLELIEMKQYLAIFLVILFTATVFAGAGPSVTINPVNPYIQGDYNIYFTVKADNNTPDGYLYYDTDQSFPFTDISGKLDLEDLQHCDSNDFSTPRNCFFEWATNTLNGTFNILLSASDGNYTNGIWSNQFIVDNTKPIISSPSPSGWFNPTTTPISVMITDNLADINQSTIRFRVNGPGLAHDCMLPGCAVSYDFSTDITKTIITASMTNTSTYDVNVDAKDNAGNAANQFHYKLSVDKNNPIAMSIDINSPTSLQKPNIDLNAYDTISGIKGIKYSCNALTWTSLISQSVFPTTRSDFNIIDPSYGCSQIDGNRNVFVSFVDQADNNSTPIYSTVIYDSTNPVSTISPYPSDWNNQDQNITINCSDTYGIDYIDYWINGVFNSVDANSLTLTLTQDGNNEIIYSCVDNASNTDGNNYAYVAIDKTPPTTTLTPTTWQNSNVNAQLNCMDANSGCDDTYYNLDLDSTDSISWDTNWYTYTSGIDVNTDGNFGVQFYSTDDVNNNESIVTDFILLDKTSPSATTLTMNTAQSDTNIQLDWTAVIDFSDVNTYIIYRQGANASPFVKISQTTDINYLDTFVLADTNEQYCYFVQTIDNAGNDSNSNTKCIWVDTISPDMNLLTNSVNNKNVTLTFLATDTNGSGVKEYFISQDKNTWIYTTNTTYTYTGLSNGTYTFFVKAKDNADNNSTDMNTIAIVNYSSPSPGGGSSGGRVNCRFINAFDKIFFNNKLTGLPKVSKASTKFCGCLDSLVV
jgi:hypothetical protein